MIDEIGYQEDALEALKEKVNLKNLESSAMNRPRPWSTCCWGEGFNRRRILEIVHRIDRFPAPCTTARGSPHCRRSPWDVLETPCQHSLYLTQIGRVLIRISG